MILKDIAQLIQTYMDLPAGKVWLKNEKIPLPSDNTFVISIGFMSLKAMGNSRRQTTILGVMSEEIASNMYGTIAIDIYGRTFDVVTRKEEIMQALNSTVCRELQIKNAFMVGSMPLTFTGLSELDGSAIPYRFQITFAVQFLSKKTKTGLEYYDNFRKEEIYDPT